MLGSMVKGLSEAELGLLFRRVKQELAKERRIPDEMKVFIHSLRMGGYKVVEIADIFGIDEAVVRGVLADPCFVNGRLGEVYRKAEETMKDRLMGLANTIMGSISEVDIEGSGLLQKSTAIGILIDKARLIGGKSTNNIAMAYELSREGRPGKADELSVLGEELGYG